MSDRADSGDLPAVLALEMAFVVHITSNGPRRALAGRVEHVTSGRSTRFASVDELTEFIQQASHATGACPAKAAAEGECS